MACRVRLTEAAERDIESIGDYLMENESSGRAVRVVERLKAVTDSLAEMPERGSIPAGLSELGESAFRHLVDAPYLVIYRVVGQEVFVDIVADGRRDMAALLARRLFEE